MKAVGLSIQLMKDLFNSLTPSAYHNIPQKPGDFQVLKTMTSLLRTVKKTDVYLLVDQLEHFSESMMDFFKNISRFVDSLVSDLRNMNETINSINNGNKCTKIRKRNNLAQCTLRQPELQVKLREPQTPTGW